MRSLSALLLTATVVATSLNAQLDAQEGRRRQGRVSARAEMNLDASQDGQAKAKTSQPALPESWVEQFTWRSVGPANMGGRITSISVNPNDHANYWVGTATGGVLRTDNYGTTYSHQFQHEAVSSIGDIMVSASHPEIVWVGTGESNPRNSVSWGNGVYKSENGGETWAHMGLEESFQIGAVEVHPTNPDIVYVGALGRLWGPSEQRGLFKTVDGGENWERVLFVDEFTGVIDMRVNPKDPEMLIVATYERERDEFDTNDPAKKWGKGSGLWKTSDGGKTWVRLTQGLPSVTLGRIGLDWSMSEEDTLYAIVETEKITQLPENSAWMGVSGEDAEVGARLTEITADSPAAEAELQVDDIIISMGGVTIHSWDGLTAEIHKHLEGETVAVIASRNRKTVEVDMTFRRAPSESEDEGEGEEEPAAKKDEAKADGGDKAADGEKAEGDDAKDGDDEEEEETPPPPGPFHIGLGGQSANVQDQQGPDGFEYGGLYRSEDAGDTWTRVNSLNPRPMYYSRVYVDPSDADRIYVLGTQLHRSKDRGETFTSDGHDGEVHVDHHNMWIDPSDGRHIILGNDGGIYVTWDRMDNWDHHNYMALGQFYRISADDTRDYRIYGGLQDNGSWGGPNRSGHDSGIVNSDWFMIGWGDGFVCRVDRENPNLVYGESQNGFIYRFNLETGEQGYVRARAPRGQQYRFNWNTPFILSEHNHALFYSAGNHVFRSWNRGNKPEAISPEISRTDRGTATELAESPRDAKVLYVGTDDGALWSTRNGGHTWEDLFLTAEEVAEQSEEEEVAEEEETEVDPTNDPVSGTWNGNASNDDLPEGQGEVLMDLKLKADGKVTGSLRTDFGLSKITKGSFDAETKKMKFTFKSDDMTGVFDLTLANNKATGTVDVGPGMITLEYTAERKQREKLKKKDSEKAKSKDRLIDVAPGRYHVSTLAASRFADGRIYLALDGHRSNDDKPYLFVSEDFGNSWKPLHTSLPESAGSIRVLVEDIENQNLLFVGSEFGSWASIDRGQTWTRFNNNLPTVPVHDYKVHPLSGELIAGTHGRSAWVVDIFALRQMAAGDSSEASKLFEPNHVIQWKREAERGPSGTRRFVGENPDSDAHIYYSLGRRQRSIQMTILDDSGEVIKTFDEISGERGLHRVDWNLRMDGQGNRRWAPRVQVGTYTVKLKAGDQVYTHKLEVLRDPSVPDPRWNR
jgi:photosystem II stability/assembly factor-like uncharacterized protein